MLSLSILGAGVTDDCMARPRSRELPRPLEATRQDVELLVHWNRELLGNLGVRVSEPIDSAGPPSAGFDRFRIASTSLTPRVSGTSAVGLASGEIRVVGGYRLSIGTRLIELKDFVLRLHDAAQSQLDVISSNGEILFRADRAMVESSNGKSIQISAMDLRLSRRLAEEIGRPSATDWQVAAARIWNAHTSVRTEPRIECPASDRWPGRPVPEHPGETYQVDVLMAGLWAQLTGCSDCTGPGGSGRIKVTPTTALRNNVNLGTLVSTVLADSNGTSAVRFAADIPWRAKFSANCPPYHNDQHPMLVWNLYRLDADGGLRQVARSGAKHAHVAANALCVENPGSNHVLGRGCQDVYGPGDNDAPDTLGPRSEVIPSRGIWARCGSIYDPECSGEPQKFRGYDAYTYRAVVPEREFAAHRGERHVLEAWYVVRDDVNPYNTMMHKDIVAVWQPEQHLWTIDDRAAPVIGPVIDSWVDPRAPHQDEANSEISTPSGRLKAAVRVVREEDGRYRYDYAIMNVDFAAVKTSGKEPDLRMIASHGIETFEVETSRGAKIDAMSFVGVGDAYEPWLSTSTSSSARWRAPSGDSLTWGTLYRFRLVSTASPTKRHGRISSDRSGRSVSYVFDTIGP
ncbi:hypothetical protein [Dokdonella fugitiva]|jgi:hypothetical protein|uniref:hypothetical protein n=1 Tax=Dokdonella fugitiva TaxID=328517 RepID=UPI0015FACF68|nr:hypothetical protein [Dokdonella fugitiva]MBA8884594.1 hypothetical protein [Dokdonella fugitiva]